MKIIQINASVNTGSTGRITEDIGKLIITAGSESLIAYGRNAQPSSSKLFRIGSNLDVMMHGLRTAIFDQHAFGSVAATKKLIQWIEFEKPDAIGLHNLHGYYLNIELLFKFIRQSKLPVIWTLFDCWAFTGHCSYFDDINCLKWKKECYACPKKMRYPSSYLIDASRTNFQKKKALFAGLNNMQLVVHSNWLKTLVSDSFLGEFPISKIHSGIDLEVFSPVSSDVDFYMNKYQLNRKKIILGVANIWIMRKGLSDFIQLSEMIDEDSRIVLVGLTISQIKSLPSNIIGIKRTESLKELAAFYSMASVFVNPTYMDNFPTTNIEALACGTPVITYSTGGSPEAVDEKTGIVVEKGNITQLNFAVSEILKNGKHFYSSFCRERAEVLFNKNDRFSEYLDLYRKAVN
jgi:glycosyltransferase involved in cell wall biosynthesis